MCNPLTPLRELETQDGTRSSENWAPLRMSSLQEHRRHLVTKNTGVTELRRQAVSILFALRPGLSL